MANYYISTTGSDTTGDGTVGNPYASLNKALLKSGLTGGDVINAAAGTYSVLAAATAVAGTLGNPIIVRGAGMGVTIFSATFTIAHNYYTVEDATWARTGIVINGVAGTTLTRVEAWGRTIPIECQNSPSDGLIDSCVIHHGNSRNGALAGKGSNWLVLNTTFRDSNGLDFMRLIGAINWTFRGCLFLRNHTAGFYTNTSSSTNSIGTGTKTFTVNTAVAYVVNDRLRFTSSGNYVEGFVTGISGLDLTLDIVTTSGSGTFSSWTVGMNDTGNHADTVQAFSDPVSHYNSYGHVFERCKWQDCDAEVGQVTQGDGDIRDWVFRNNVFWNSRIQINVYAPEFKFYNNTIYRDESDAGFAGKSETISGLRGDGTPIEVWNNIFCQSGTISTGGCWSGSFVNTNADYNFTSSYGTNSAKDATKYTTNNGINTGGITPYDLFVDPDNGDFNLKPGSPAIGAGIDLSAQGFSNDYTGTTRSGTWDMGAYAYAVTGIPTISSATIPSDGVTVNIVWSESCTTGTGGAGGFTLTTSSGPMTLTYVSGSGSTTYVYSIPSTILSTETITSLAYVQPGNGIEATAGGGDVGTFTEFAVTNNSTQYLAASVSNRNKHRLNPGTRGAFL